MTRFLFLADTHEGASPMGYQQQRGCPEHLPALRAALRRRLGAEAADFILHGGDLVDAATEDNLRAAASAWALPVPVRLCLGNHDLTAADAVERWRALAPDFFPGGRPEFSIVTPDCVVHVAPNHWCEQPYFWKDRQRAHFSPDQVARLRRDLRQRPDLPHLLLTHSPVFGLPPEQTGMPAPYHAPDPEFTDAVTRLADEHPALRCVLGAHNHMNLHVERRGVHYVTVSSFAETPFEAKCFAIAADRLEMRTIRLDRDAGLEVDYNPERAFVQGRERDRAFTLALR